MTFSRRLGFLLLTICVASGGAEWVKPQGAIAQTVTADGTTATSVTPTGSAFVITGGDTAGKNLFHSFTDFSPANISTLFNVNGSTIERVISRVTGTNISNIDGLLSVTGGNSPDFFLINPNGIILGANAVLNVPGSFLASTAESIHFTDGGEFSTTDTTLLSVTAPIGLGMGSNPGSITNAATFTPTGSPTPLGLLVGAGGTTETIGLVGGEVNLTGGTLTALGGHIEVGAVGANETVDLTTTTIGYELDYRNTKTFADINLSQGAMLNSSGVGSGPMQLRGDRINISEQSRILAATLGAISGSEINVTARQLNLDTEGAIISSTEGTGAGADLTLNATASVNLLGLGYERGVSNIIPFLTTGMIDPLQLGTTIVSVTRGSGTAGKLQITAPRVEFQEGSGLGSTTLAAGNAGSVTIQSSQHILANGAILFTGTSFLSTGRGGDVNLQTPTLQVQDGGLISTSTFGAGQAGKIKIDATTIGLTDTRSTFLNLGLAAIDNNFIFRTSIDSTTLGQGGSSDVDINTQTLHIGGGSAIVASTSGALFPNAGQGGQLNVTASESILIDGRFANRDLFSELDVSTTSSSAAGALTVNTQNLTIQNGGRIGALTRSRGASGTVTINASEDVIIRNQGLVSTSAIESATGAGGDINIAAGASLQLLKKSQITTTTNQGNGGNLNLNAGDILLLRQGSLISTTAGQAGGSGNGGNITINAPVIAGYENSDIVANAFAGKGGNINITTQGIFGLVFRDQLTSGNDITASSQFGVNGTITVNEFSLDPSSGLMGLVTALQDATDQVDATCAVAGKSQFIATGRGGIPPAPETQSGGGVTPWQDTRDLSGFLGVTAAPPQVTQAPAPLREATGFQALPTGQITLMAEPGSSHAHRHHATCAIAAMTQSEG